MLFEYGLKYTIFEAMIIFYAINKRQWQQSQLLQENPQRCIKHAINDEFQMHSSLP